jgi:hypothetical protein
VLGRREAGHRSIRHQTIELSPNGGEFIVITQLVYAHNQGYTQICINQTGVAARTKTWGGWASRLDVADAMKPRSCRHSAGDRCSTSVMIAP